METRTCFARARGFTLIEALVALLVLSVGLLGVAAMQLKSLQGAHAAYQRSIASLAAQDAQERLWEQLVLAGDTQPSGTVKCPVSDDAASIESAWIGEWENDLPGMRQRSDISTVSQCEYDVTVSWAEGRFSNEATPVLEYTVRLPKVVVP